MWDLIPRLIAAARQRLQQGRARRADASALKAHKRHWGDAVALSLAELVHSAESKASGRVQLLTLADFREHIGALWPTYADKVVLIAETTIARMIGKGNTFIPQGEDTWLLLFPGLEVSEALERADAIAARIGEKLVGENFAPDMPPPPLTVLLDTAGVVRTDGSIDGVAFRAAVAFGRKPKPKSDARGPQTAATEVKWALRPGWCAETETIDTFALRSLGSPEAVLAITAELIAQMDARKLRARLVLPLAWSAVVASNAEALRAQMIAIPQRLRLHHLRIAMYDIPSDTPLELVAALREGLRPLVREVALVIDPKAPDHPLFTLAHVVFVADLGAIGKDDGDLGEMLSRLRRAAGDQRLAITGLADHAQIRTALDAGADEIGGASLARDLRELPQRLTVLHRRDLMM